MTLLERHRENQKKLKATVQAYIDRKAKKDGWCLHCKWRSGRACVLPRCLSEKVMED